MDTNYIKGLASKLPRVELAYLPTPLDYAAHLSESLGVGKIYIKREDMTGLALGGNKARQLEFLLGDAQACGADCIILSAAAQSNMVRITVAAAAKLGMDAYPVLRSSADPEPAQGNLLLDYLLGAKITLISTQEPYSQLSVDVMNEMARDLRRKGRTPYIIDVRYHSGPLAAIAYALAAAELEEQFETLNIHPSHIFVTISSGTTQAGLLLGAAILEGRYQVVGISAQKPSDWICPRIREKASQAAKLLDSHMNHPITDDTILVDDRWIGKEYGVPSRESIEAVNLVARSEGVLLDPVYSGKGMSGLIGWAREGKLTRKDTVVFIHSGGVPALFTWADVLSRDLPLEGMTHPVAGPEPPQTCMGDSPPHFNP